MLISLQRLPVEGLRFEHRYETGELDVSAHEFALREPPIVTGLAKRSGLDVRLTGELQAALSVPCDRCLQETVFQVAQPFDLLYLPVEAENQRGGETELHERDLDFSIYAEDQIDLDQMVREQLELALPARVLCRADCRGLCAQCGADLNLEQCQCQKPVDPRWQALAELKTRLEEKD
jgi:uncharacterized protein